MVEIYDISEHQWWYGPDGTLLGYFAAGSDRVYSVCGTVIGYRQHHVVRAVGGDVIGFIDEERHVFSSAGTPLGYLWP